MQLYKTIKLKTDYTNCRFFLFSLSLIGSGLFCLVGICGNKIDTSFLVCNRFAEKGVMQASHNLQKSVPAFSFEQRFVKKHPGCFSRESENPVSSGKPAFISNSFILGTFLTFNPTPDYLQAGRV